MRAQPQPGESDPGVFGVCVQSYTGCGSKLLLMLVYVVIRVCTEFATLSIITDFGPSYCAACLFKQICPYSTRPLVILSAWLTCIAPFQMGDFVDHFYSTVYLKI